MQEVYNAVKTNAWHAVLLLGSGGSGKTRLCKELYDLAVADHGKDKVARCANSGRVACNARCKTFASRLGYGSYEASRKPPFDKFKAAERAAKVEFLIVEEVSAMTDRHITAHVKVRLTLLWPCLLLSCVCECV